MTPQPERRPMENEKLMKQLDMLNNSQIEPCYMAPRALDLANELATALAAATEREARMREACEQGRIRAENFLKGMRFAPEERTAVTLMVDSMIQALQFDFAAALSPAKSTEK